MSTPHQSPSNPSPVTSVNGHIVSAREAVMSIQDWGFRYGWGAFETIRVTQGCPLFLARHLERFSRNAAALLLVRGDETGWWRKEILRTLGHARYTEAALNLYWTRGEAPRFAGRKIVSVRPLHRGRRRTGRVWVAPWRIEPGTPGVGAKTLCYLPYMFAAVAAQAAGFDDALLLNPRGRIADGATASVFLIEDGQLLTPRPGEGALPGITRDIILRATRAMGIPAKAVALPWNRLLVAEGVFLTSVLRGLTTVRQIGDQTVHWTAEAHALTKRLRGAYRRAVAREIASFRE